MTISIAGKAKVAKIYNLARLEMEGVDFDEFDLESKEDVKELFEIVSDYVETAEADAIEAPQELHMADPDEVSIEIAGKKYYPDELVLKNQNIVELLSSIQEAKEGDLFYIVTMEGDGRWDIDCDTEEVAASDVALDYVDCSILFDQYDILKEGYLDVVCDTILPEKIEISGVQTELEEFFFEPIQMYGQLYVVKKDPVADINVLQKVDFGGRKLAGTDMDVDDFEEN